MEKIGYRIKKMREDHNFTQEEVAEYLNISQGHLANIESNKRNLPLSKLFKLCDLYNCSEDLILYGNKNLNKNNFVFRKDNDKIDLNTIAHMNKIVNNLKFLKEITKEDNHD